MKKSLMLLTVFAMVFALAACGGKDNDTGNDGAVNGSGEEAVTIKAIGHTTWFIQGMEAVMVEAKKQGFNLEIEKVPDGSDGENLMKTRFATNDKPDLLFYQSAITQSAGFGNPEEVFVAQDDQPWMQNFDKVAWKNLMDSDDNLQDDVESHWYGAPYGGANTGMVLYNKKLFAELKLEIPTNMDEFWAVSEKIKSAGKTPVFLSGKDAWTVQLPVLMSNATQETADLIAKINVNQAKVTDLEDSKTGMKFLQELMSKGMVNDDVLSATYDEAQKALSEGEAGMYLMATWVMNEIVTKYPEGVNDIGAFIMPYKGEGKDLAALWQPWSMYVVKGPKQDAVQEFVNWFEQPEIQDIFFSNQGGIPAIKGVTKTKLTPAEVDAKKFLDAGQGLGNVPYPPLYNYNVNLPTLSQELIIKGGKTPEQVLEAQQKELETAAKAKGDPNFK